MIECQGLEETHKRYAQLGRHLAVYRGFSLTEDERALHVCIFLWMKMNHEAVKPLHLGIYSKLSRKVRLSYKFTYLLIRSDIFMGKQMKKYQEAESSAWV